MLKIDLNKVRYVNRSFLAAQRIWSFYEPLVSPQFVGSHYFWSNFFIKDYNIENRNHREGTVETLQTRKNLDILKYNIVNKRQILRNCVEPELGLHIFQCAFTKSVQKQII